MSQYSTGLVSTTNGSSVITGTSTAWLTSGIDASDFFIAAGDTVAYTIASIDSDTQITLTANYAGSTQSGITYTAHIERFGALPIFSDNDADTPELMNEVVKFTVNQDSALGTASTKDTGTAAGEVPLNSDLGSASLVDAIGSGDLYGRDSIIGTVSETAGVPTGAIIESGSNANGEYTKFADGTLICRLPSQPTTFLNTSNLKVDWSYPVPFLTPPEVLPSIDLEEFSSTFRNIKPLVYARSIGNISCDVGFASDSEFTSGVESLGDDISAVAIGRWY